MYTITKPNTICLTMFISLLILNTIHCYLTYNPNDILPDWDIINHDQNEVYSMKLPIHYNTENPLQSTLPSYWNHYFTDNEPRRYGHYSQRLGK
ncbi:unnamed protein product [Schistosoma rodhaini]|uniref:hypothetical protein n=1 Tax=Schistosoma mansoni TaxID=6183 RepID=UPI0001A643E5|nr:hypothetical protein Smp_154220 [Schistosoma mansoni]CAH8630984.1 unnamed protein product [Schistosoma rodhaini]|eukprot:XP_018653347.1 hypothetical protein Smp_154220 [Schistosoma mansoni]